MDITKNLPKELTEKFKFSDKIPGPAINDAKFGVIDTTTLTEKRCEELIAAGCPWIEKKTKADKAEDKK